MNENERLANLILFTEKKADSIFHELKAKNADIEVLTQMADLCDVITEMSNTYGDNDLFGRITEAANELDASNDPNLQKVASLLDDVLMFKNVLFRKSASEEEELKRLREEYSAKTREHDYGVSKKKMDKDNQVEETTKSFAEAIKTYRPCQAPLSTRYDPDHPGVNLIRISDNVYQSSLTGKIYDFYTGFTTNKGNKIPGSSVDRQIPDWSNQAPAGFMFDTRDGRMSSVASTDEKKNLVKEAAAKYDTRSGRLSESKITYSDSDISTKSFREHIKEGNPGLADLQAEASSFRRYIKTLIDGEDIYLKTAKDSVEEYLKTVIADNVKIDDSFRTSLFNRDDVNSLELDELKELFAKYLKDFDEDLEKSGFYIFPSNSKYFI